MTPDLVSLGTLHFTMKDTLVLKDVPVGTRVLVEFTELQWKGERLQAEQAGAQAGDWLTVDAQGIALLDIRFTLKTPSGSLIYVHGPGRTDAKTFPTGGAMYFFPSFETNDPQLAWLNRLASVARGTAKGNTATLEIYEIR